MRLVFMVLVLSEYFLFLFCPILFAFASSSSFSGRRSGRQPFVMGCVFPAFLPPAAVALHRRTPRPPPPDPTPFPSMIFLGSNHRYGGAKTEVERRGSTDKQHLATRRACHLFC